MNRPVLDPLATAEAAAKAAEMAAVMRHDIRNKLGVVRNAAFYLRRKAESNDLWTSDPRVATFFGLIDRDLAAIADVLDAGAAARALPRRVEPVRAAAGISMAIDTARVPDATKVVFVSRDDDLTIDIDLLELALAVRCLIENGAEAMPAGGMVRVAAAQSDLKLVVEVRDEGADAVAAPLADFARPFHTTKPGRLGLGVNVARRIADRYGGELSHERRGKGVAAILSFPLPRAPAVAVTRILLVDDDESNRLTTSALLEDEGYEVDVAASFSEASRLVGAGAYAIAVLDQRLGDGLGTDLVPLIRARVASAKILLVSGNVGTGDLPPGADAYIAKGDPFAVLAAAIRKFAGGAERS